jgi:hypothetical protein
VANGSEDRWAVCDVVYAFAEAMDSRDWTLYRSVFTPKIEIDYSFFHPDQKGEITASEWADNVAGRLSRLAATQHSMTNPRPRIDGERARCAVYAQAHHTAELDGELAWCLVGGEYTFGLVRASEGWLIDAVALRPHFITGDQRVLGVARA